MEHRYAPRVARWAIFGVAGSIMMTAAYLATSTLRDDSPSANAQGLHDTAALASEGAAQSSANPDTTQPFWYVPYLDEDGAKPRFDQTVNGIRVGPNVLHDGGPPCSPGAAQLVDESVADGTPLETPVHPDHGELQRHDTTACDGVVVAHELEYYAPPDPNLDAKIRSGKARWETSAHGTSLSIYRFRTTSPAWNSGIASDRWHAGSIKGRPAAIARPVHDIGLGVSTIVIWDPEVNVQTTLVANNLTIGQLTAIAQELYQ